MFAILAQPNIGDSLEGTSNTVCFGETLEFHPGSVVCVRLLLSGRRRAR